MREIGFGLACGVIMALGAFLVAAWPVHGRPVAAFFRAGSSEREMLAAVVEAGGSLVEINAASSVIVTLGAGEGFTGALYHAGAWLVIDAGLARLCTSALERSSR